MDSQWTCRQPGPERDGPDLIEQRRHISNNNCDNKTKWAPLQWVAAKCPPVATFGLEVSAERGKRAKSCRELGRGPAPNKLINERSCFANSCAQLAAPLPLVVPFVLFAKQTGCRLAPSARLR